MSIVQVRLGQQNYAAAAEALPGVDLSRVTDEDLRYLTEKFTFEEWNEDKLPLKDLQACCEVLLKVSIELDRRYEAVKEQQKDAMAQNRLLNKKHLNHYRRAYALYHLDKPAAAELLLSAVLEEKPRGPYTFRIGFLRGSIAAKQGDYQKVMRIYNKLLSLYSQSTLHDRILSLKIRVKNAAALMACRDKALLIRGFASASLAKDTNTAGLGKEAELLVEEASYLAIFFASKLGKDDEVVRLKKEFLKKYKTSAYRNRLLRLK